MKQKTIKLSGKDFAIYCNTKAFSEIEEECGDISKLGEYISAENEKRSVIYRRIAHIITALLNGAVFKHNSEITLGLTDGEKKQFITNEAVESILSPADIGEYSVVIMSEIASALGVKDMENVAVDPDLADCPSEKNE